MTSDVMTFILNIVRLNRTSIKTDNKDVFFFHSDTNAASAHVQGLVYVINVKILTGSTQWQEMNPRSWQHCYLIQK